MWNRWLIDRPVVEWRVVNWVLLAHSNVLVGLREAVSINSIDSDTSDSEIFLAFETTVVMWGWLVDRPVVVWWVLNWVLSISLEEGVTIDTIDGDVS